MAILLLAIICMTYTCGCAKKEEPKVEEGAAIEESSETEQESHVATSEDMTTVEDVVEEGMQPVYAKDLNPGTYPVEMVSSSSMFQADHAELVVEGDEMKVVLYMTSEAYPYMYAGTAAEADAAKEEEYILPEEVGDGMRTFTLPLGALDSGESFAAFSKKKELWYDRTLLFRVDSLPADAFSENFFVTAESLALTEGEYNVNVSLAGGSGRASVESPTKLIVGSEGAKAVITWSSSNYDYMIVGEEKILPTNTEGNSTFEIPVSHFDRPMNVTADTTAMSTSHEIDYTLTFDSSSIEPEGGI